MKLEQAIKKIKFLLSSVKLSQQPLEDGSLIQFDGDSPEKGSEVYLLDSAGNTSLLPDGSYKAKSGLAFTIKDGKADSVDTTNLPAPAKEEDKPKAQAQSAEVTEPTEVKQAEDSASGTTATESTTQPEEVASTAFTLEAIGLIIDKKLLPVWDAIAAMQSSMGNYPAYFKAQQETVKVVEEISTLVTKLSELPAGTPIEQEVNPFKKAPKDIKDSRAFRITQSLNK